MERKVYTKPIIQAVIIMAIFYVVEIIFVYCDLFPNKNVLIAVDSVLRFALGTVGLVILNGYYKRGESKYSVKQLFTNKIPVKTWLVLIPFIIYILLPFVNICIARDYTFEFIGPLSIVIVQQFATGYYEEGVQRGLMMNGLINHNISTVKQRIFTVAMTGLFFGLGHVPNIVFGENPLVQGSAAAVWGMFIAAIFMLSDNIFLVMMFHALSDSTIRIVNYIFIYDRDNVVYHCYKYARDGIDYVILPLVAIYICVNYDRLKKGRIDKES